MLTKIRLENFKLHKDTSIDLKPLTIFIGPNNSGKSSLAHAILLLQNAIQRGGSEFIQSKPAAQPYNAANPIYRYPYYPLDVGEFADILKEGEEEISIGISGQVKVGLSEVPEVSTESLWQIFNNQLVAHEGKITTSRFGDIQWKYEQSKTSDLSPSQIQINEFTIGLGLHPSYQLLHYGASYPGGLSPKIIAKTQGIASAITSSPRTLISTFLCSHAIRGFEERLYRQPGQGIGPFGINLSILEDRIIALTAALVYDVPLRERVSGWFDKLLGIRLTISQQPPNLVYLKSTSTKRGTLLINEGLGSNQLVFLLLPIALAGEGYSIFLEEPEAHFHPRAQTELSRLFARVVKEENKQLIIATHSEHIIYGILNAINKGELNKEQVCLWYFNNDNGTSKAESLEINDKGQVSGGLKGFYEHTLNEIADFLKITPD